LKQKVAPSHLASFRRHKSKNIDYKISLKNISFS
jgi:hypothetical protein